MKTCYRCGVELPFEDFYRHPQMADGRLNKCKACCKREARSYGRAWRDANPGRVAEKNRRDSEWARIKRQDGRLNPEEKAALAPIRAEHQRQSQLVRNARYEERHRERIALNRAIKRDGRFNADEQAVYRAGYRAEQRRLWALANPEKQQAWRAARRARKMAAPGTTTAEQRRARWDYYGGRCWMCGATATDMDHVIALSRGGSHWPANQRPACSPCNGRKNDRDHREFLAAAV